MKNKKLEKKTLFVFKKNNLTNLTKEQMRRIYGGETTNGAGGDLSTNHGCVEQKTLVTISD
jgi:ABC-type phosphate transport system substrate-binding protein